MKGFESEDKQLRVDEMEKGELCWSAMGACGGQSNKLEK